MSTFTAVMDNFVTEINRKKQWLPSSTYWRLKLLCPDQIGEFGERFAKELMRRLGSPYLVTWSNETGSKEYDILITNQLTGKSIRLEVKTATQGNTPEGSTQNPTFQHEDLRKDRGYDAILFLDFGPDAVYATFLTKNEIPFDESNHDSSVLPHHGPLTLRDDGLNYKYTFGLYPAKRTTARGIVDNEIKNEEDFLSKFKEMEIRYQSEAVSVSFTDTSVSPKQSLLQEKV